jgi:DNA-binding LacI/PurR family transcriptional regulator
MIAKMILDMIKNKKEVIPRQILIEPDLIVRDSTKPVT